jgi:prepilin-type N-terminal cleavage/methylation domain-containing protein
MVASHTMRRTHRGAYTLIELLLVVALLGLASALLIPYLEGRDSLRVQAAVRQVVADLSFAQSDALAHQEYRRVHFYDDGRGYCIVRVGESQVGSTFDPDTADYIYDPLAFSDESSRFVVDFTNDSRFTGVAITGVSIDSNGADVYYDPLGGTVRASGVPGTGGTITMEADGYTYRITISAFTGKLTVQEVTD